MKSPHALFAFVIATAAPLLFPTQAFPADHSRVRIAQVADFFLYAPLYVAADSGLFQSLGLDVSIINSGGDDKAWAAVVTGDADFAVGDPTFVAISGARGRPGRVVASIVNGVPFWGVTWRDDIKPFTSWKDLGNYSIATFPAPSTAYALQRRMFLEAGLKPNIREGAFGALLTMAKTGRADIALELEPNVSQAAAQGAHVVFSLARAYGNFAITGLSAAPRILNNEHELTAKMVCALQLALDTMHSDKEQALQILQRRFREITPEVAHAAYERVLQAGIVPRTARIESDAWEKAISLRKQLGDLKGVAQTTDYVENSYAERALTTPACRRQ